MPACETREQANKMGRVGELDEVCVCAVLACLSERLGTDLTVVLVHLPGSKQTSERLVVLVLTMSRHVAT